jgi:hypothetical protein
MALDLVIENAGLDGARAVVDPVSIRQYEARGWVAVGFTSEPTREPCLTDVEQAALDAADAERLAALKSDAAPATSRPRK